MLQKRMELPPAANTSLASPGAKLVLLTSHFSLADLPDEIQWLNFSSRVCSNHTDKYMMVEWLERRRKDHCCEQFCILIDLESLGGVSRSFEFLRNLRASFQSIPVIIFTSRAKFHDFSSERAVICDATLRFPFSAIDLESAIEAARKNNRVLLDRIEEANYE